MCFYVFFMFYPIMCGCQRIACKNKERERERKKKRENIIEKWGNKARREFVYVSIHNLMIFCEMWKCLRT